MQRNELTAGTAITILLVVVAAVGVEPAVPVPANSKPQIVRVELVQKDATWQLFRGGVAYQVRGAGGSGSLELLAKSGGNSVRTWGADNLEHTLDEANKLGLTVAVGIWLGHERHGFRYDDPKQIENQRKNVRTIVTRFKAHPAVLLWGLGNELEQNPIVLKEVNYLASMVKELDPDHPTMTVTADLAGDSIKKVHELCPQIDLLGVNSYAGGPTVIERYRAAGVTKPFLLTEYGPPGPWESLKTSWGAPQELSSTEKALHYRRAYKQAARPGLCVGSYAFLWGYKQEATATWFGMLLPDGSRTESVDVLSELWRGVPVSNRCPRIRQLVADGSDVRTPASELQVHLDVTDQEGDQLTAKWSLRAEVSKPGQGGDFEEAPDEVKGAIIEGSITGCRVILPNKPGAYRLFVIIQDQHRGAAVANLPINVRERP